MWSVIDTDGRSAMRSAETTEIEFGESRIFSGSAPRVAVVTTWLSCAASSASPTLSVVVAPAFTCTPSVRLAANPMRVTTTV
jgi:hypothetical protein